MERASVRPARPGDLAAIRDLFDELDRFHAAGEPALLRVPPVPRFTPDELDELIACETCFAAVAEVDGQVVGFVDASIRGPEDATTGSSPGAASTTWPSRRGIAARGSGVSSWRRPRRGPGRKAWRTFA